MRKKGWNQLGSKRPLTFAGDRGDARADKPRWFIFSDCGALQDGGDDFHIPATMRAVLDADLKHPLQQSRPTDTHGNRGMRHSHDL
ncbi:MAG: hypothetical protein Q8R46_14145 [Nitrosomonas sp.]|uniref:hypothetical protein n=1 Tax=Nitrosomonas sp. TaxID=42353 RepID=UPI002732748D|nr:hypothetical protein [Nitrosomonas sp.]MDP3664520.1 hypothetical protein [Nitrosomonas sp.]